MTISWVAVYMPLYRSLSLFLSHSMVGRSDRTLTSTPEPIVSLPRPLSASTSTASTPTGLRMHCEPIYANLAQQQHTTEGILSSCCLSFFPFSMATDFRLFFTSSLSSVVAFVGVFCWTGALEC